MAQEHADDQPLGTVEELPDETYRLTFHRDYPHPEERVWTFITTPERTRLWWAESRGDLHGGAPFDLRWLNGRNEELDWWDGQVVTSDWERTFEIANVQHGRIRFDLQPLAVERTEGTRLTFTNVVSDPDFLGSSLAGWHLHLDHLRHALDGHPVDWPHWWEEQYPHWEQIRARYEPED